MASVFDVADYVLQRLGKPITAMKLQKLVYYSQAWSLVWDEKPLFCEKIEAWANGPVSRELYDAHKGEFEVRAARFNDKGDASRLAPEQRETLDAVLDFYGQKSSHWLSELTHAEQPWKDARNGLTAGERGNAQITHSSMAEYYGSL